VPYAKYLDCGADMFHEIVATHWLTAAGRPLPQSSGSDDSSSGDDSSGGDDSGSGGQGSGSGDSARRASSTASGAERRPPAGLVVRLQGFDRGVFGGNFHTHNCLPLPPGLDVVVCSNGADWVKNWRHALAAAKQVHERERE
jgi:hypothetical protein